MDIFSSPIVYSILFLCVAIIFPRFYSIYQRYMQYREWKKFAAQNDLNFNSGVFPWSYSTVTGVCKQYPILVKDVWRQGYRNSFMYVQFVIRMQKETPVFLNLHAKGDFSIPLPDRTETADATDIHLGDSLIDPRYSIKGGPENQIVPLVDTEPMRKLLLFPASLALAVDGSTIYYQQDEIEDAADHLTFIGETLIALADSIEKLYPEKAAATHPLPALDGINSALSSGEPPLSAANPSSVSVSASIEPRASGFGSRRIVVVCISILCGVCLCAFLWSMSK